MIYYLQYLCLKEAVEHCGKVFKVAGNMEGWSLCTKLGGGTLWGAGIDCGGLELPGGPVALWATMGGEGPLWEGRGHYGRVGSTMGAGRYYGSLRDLQLAREKEGQGLEMGQGPVVESH